MAGAYGSYNLHKYCDRVGQGRNGYFLTKKLYNTFWQILSPLSSAQPHQQKEEGGKLNSRVICLSTQVKTNFFVVGSNQEWYPHYKMTFMEKSELSPAVNLPFPFIVIFFFLPSSDKDHSIFMIKLYIWFSTTKWTGRHDLRSWVAGSQVSQESALYCSNTNLGQKLKRPQKMC